MSDASIYEILADKTLRSVDPHEVARELAELHKLGDASGVRRLRDSYLVGIARRYPHWTADGVAYLVDDNLLDAAGLADTVSECGYEASGQLHALQSHDGPVAHFFKKAAGYKAD